MAHQTGAYAIEFENREGKPSGISVTTAKEFVLVDYEWVIFFATESFRYLLDQIKRKKVIGMGYRNEEGRQCKGWLIPKDAVLLSPYAKVVERWF